MRSLFAEFEPLVWMSVVLLSCPDGVRAASWFEGWATADIGSYRAVYEETTFIRGDLGYWYVGDTWSNNPERGPSPHEAIITFDNGSTVLLLSSVDTGTGIADNIWVELRDFVTHNSGFSIPITSTTVISFDEVGELFNPDPWRGPPCIFPPCGDHIGLELTDNAGHIVVYVLQRPSGAQPDIGNPGYGTLYTEIFLDPTLGRQTRNVFNDFSTLSTFNPTGARITSVAFDVAEHGWALIDNIFISDTGNTPPPPPPQPIDIDWIGIASSKNFRVGVPESDKPWSFQIWVTLANRGAVTHIDLIKPHGSVPFGTIHWDGGDMWDWGSDSSYSSLANLQLDYPPGTYTLEFRSASDVLLRSVPLDYNDLPAEPTQPVHFTYPSTDHQTDVNTSPTITWTVNQSAGDGLMLGLHDYLNKGDDRIEAPVSMSTNSWPVGSLLGNHEYGVWISVWKVKDWVGPDWPTTSIGGDVFKYTLGIGYLNQLDFSTGAPIYVLHDWNGDGIVSIIGDVPPFVDCVYFGNCPAWPQARLLGVGDCSHDGILSIISDVPCFVQCVYFGNCPK